MLNCSDSEHMDPEEENGNDFISEDSRQILDVATMRYNDVMRLMEYVNIKSTESGTQDRKLLREYLYNKDWKGSHKDKMQETVNKAMNKYITGKEKLLKIYIEIEKIAATDPFKEKASQYMKQFQERMNQFGTDDIQICILGWTCTGKSTFFNILLGEDIMQTHCLPDTRCLVRLHNSETREIQFVDKDNSSKTMPLTDDKEDVKRKLKSILDQFSGSDTSLGAVDLYWPIPRLHKNVVFVDVPGIGDTNEMTQKVMNHVSNAAGYICMINSADGGGVLEGGIVQLFQRIKEIACTDGRTNKKLGNVLCVCNKWDLVNVDDRETVLKYTRERLKGDFGVLNDWQIIPFSAYMELQHLQLRARPTNEFVKILEGLERLVSGTTKKRFFNLFGCINELIQWSEGVMDEEICAKTTKLNELTAKTTSKENELKKAEEKIDTGSMAVERLIDVYKTALIKNLQEYLKSSEVQKEVFNWKKSTPALKDLKVKGPLLVRERIIGLISKWAEKEGGLLKKAIEDTEKECKEQAAKIKAYFASTKEIEMYNNKLHDVDINWKPLILTAVGITMAEIVAAGIGTVVIAVTFSLLAATGFGILVLAPLGIGLNAGVVKYRYNSLLMSEMTRLTQTAMDEVSSDTKTETLINTLFECPCKKWIEEFKDMMQGQIKSIREDLHKLKGDVQSESESLSTWTNLRNELLTCSENLTQIRTDYDNDDLMQ